MDGGGHPHVEAPVNSKLMRHHGTQRWACIGVTCAFGSLIALFIWLIAESVFALH
jgi:hypothetical protein